jgi:tocopherol O-methyltransferase
MAAILSPLKERIKAHYDLCSNYYNSLWVRVPLFCSRAQRSSCVQGEHIHHGYFLTPSDSKELAQKQLIELLLQRAARSSNDARVLDVGCGIGGTSRYLARERGWDVTGVTISDVQVAMAYDLSRRASASESAAPTLVNTTPVNEKESAKLEPDTTPAPTPASVSLGRGAVRFLELDAETISPRFPPDTFDLVWICEALSHLPGKPAFFTNAHMLLRPGGRLVIADWIKAPGLSAAQFDADIAPIERGMLLPPLATADEYCAYAKDAGLAPVGEVLDISEKVAKTW